MKKIIFATSSEGKMREIREIMQPEFQVVSLKELGLKVEIEENGSTFEENAVIKAKEVMRITGEIVLSDDSGLEIDYLNKEPGIYSARYLGEETSYTIKNAAILERMKEARRIEERVARFVCATAAAFPDGRLLITRGEMEGVIAEEERGENGFGYDPIFMLPSYNQTSAEISAIDKNKESHRGQALRKMKEELNRHMKI